MNRELEEKLALLPDKPGVYLMKDEQSRIIYVGKAVNLKNRVRSYFQSSRNHSPKEKAMIAKIEIFEYIITASEIEALILECNLIKKHHPKYNISLRDDKNFPYVKVTLQEAFPRVFATRRVLKDGARYFGPYTDAGAIHSTLKLLKTLFPLRACHRLDAKRPCLEHHIKRCLAPCAGKVSQASYGEMIKAVCLFLEGRSDAVAKKLKQAMAAAAEKLEFEQAARLRDQLAAVEKVIAKQNIITGSGDQDAIGLADSAAGTCVQVFFIRSGKLIGREHFLLQSGGDEGEAAEEAALTAFVKQYYSRAAFIPREILLPAAVAEQELLAVWLTERRGAKVAVEVPRRGVKRDLVAMAASNAMAVLDERAARLQAGAEQDPLAGGLQELAAYLGLVSPPYRVECFDISHIQGSETVASLVVFTDGKPDKAAYRRYKLTTVEGKPDDFRSMQEVVGRRYRVKAGKAAEPVPDLIIIDGGKGQLSSALAIIRQCGLTETPVVGLAKEFEHIFREGNSEPLILPRHSAALYLVQRIRDEAHRFAITYHRKLRAKRNMVSVLDHIGGIGPRRRQALWEHFGTLAKIKAAAVAELAAAPAMTLGAAEAVYNFFRNKG